MNNKSLSDANKWINLIDSRIKKFLPPQSEYMGIVTSVNNDNKKARVKILGADNNDPEIDILNKTNEILFENDNVIIKAINGSLSNSFIWLKF